MALKPKDQALVHVKKGPVTSLMAWAMPQSDLKYRSILLQDLQESDNRLPLIQLQVRLNWPCRYQYHQVKMKIRFELGSTRSCTEFNSFLSAVRRMETLEQRVNGHDQANRALLEQIMKLTQDTKVRIEIIYLLSILPRVLQTYHYNLVLMNQDLILMLKIQVVFTNQTSFMILSVNNLF